MSENSSSAPGQAAPARLEDVMVAMDVVDTLRHQQDIAVRELDTQGRRERLMQRLRDLYSAQGIDVSDAVLSEGIKALEEERFQYQPVRPSWRTKLAHLWVSRRRWSKPVGFLTVLGSLFGGVYVATDVLPERELRTQLPTQLSSTVKSIQELAENPQVVDDATRQLNVAKAALQESRLDDAKAVLAEMQSVQQLLGTRYTVRVVARRGQKSGVWRVPDINESARNYYLIVEAIGDDNKAIKLDILDEESNERKKVAAWGLRVNEKTFYAVATDKSDDGIIQNNVIGNKRIGYLRPTFSIPTTGGTITQW